MKWIGRSPLWSGLRLPFLSQLGQKLWAPNNVSCTPLLLQQTINQQAAGGEIVEVTREDDPNGKWNYEVVVRTSGKE